MPKMIIQWHLTTNCEQNCKHCYLRNSKEEQEEKKRNLSLKDNLLILKSLKKMANKLSADLKINFTGGDPMLSPYLFPLLKKCKDESIETAILGNPHLLNKKNLGLLRKYNLVSYQMSLDGMKKIHDSFRGKGSFEKTLLAFKRLKEYNIKTTCMFTLSKENKDDLFDLVKYIYGKVDVFDFARLVPMGNSKEMIKSCISGKEYKKILYDLLELYNEFSRDKYPLTTYGRKEHLWTLLYKELGLLPPLDEDRLIHSGCSIGMLGFTILSNGKVVACRRLPIEIGDLTKSEAYEIFINSKRLNELRDINKFDKCVSCPLLCYCRGSPCVSYGVYGFYTKPDPGCWRKI